MYAPPLVLSLSVLLFMSKIHGCGVPLYAHPLVLSLSVLLFVSKIHGEGEPSPLAANLHPPVPLSHRHDGGLSILEPEMGTAVIKINIRK